MPPQWIEYPALSEFSMGWRMGAGEDYNNFKNICFKKLRKPCGKKSYLCEINEKQHAPKFGLNEKRDF